MKIESCSRMRVLADEILRRRGRSERSKSSSVPGTPGSWMRSRLDTAAPRSAPAIRSSAVSPSALRAAPAASAAGSRAQEGRRGRRGAVVAARDDDRRPRRRWHADLLAQLDDDPLRGALADARDRLQAAESPAAIASISSRGCRPTAPPSPPSAPPPARRERQEEVALVLGGEAEELQAVVAHHEMRVQRTSRGPRRGPCAASPPNGLAVADPAGGLDHDVVGAARHHLPADERDHPANSGPQRTARRWRGRWRPPARRRRGPATASRAATAASPTIAATWPFSARPEPHTAPLTSCGRVVDAATPRRPADSITTPRACPTAKAVRAF